MTDPTFDRCVDFAAGAPVADFTAWLYATCDDDWGDDGALYLELLDVDFRNRYAVIEARALLRRHVEARDPGVLARHRAAWIARGLIAGEVEVAAACRELYQLHGRVAEVGSEWIGHDDELDNPWDASEALLAQIVEDARALLAALEQRDQNALRSSAGAGTVGSHDRHS